MGFQQGPAAAGSIVLKQKLTGTAKYDFVPSTFVHGLIVFELEAL